jgi:glucose-1-phosphate thymidylyltransferase
MAITAILLAAGYATRLYPLTSDRPKALLPLGPPTRPEQGKPESSDPLRIAPVRLRERVILDEVLRSLSSVQGVGKRILVTNHRFAGQFREWQHSCGANVHLLDDGTDTAQARLGAVRDLALAERTADPQDDLLVVGTDNLFRWSLADFVAPAQRYRPRPSIALWEAPSREAATRFGVVQRDQTSRIAAFVEKSPHPPSAEVALCVYYFPAPMRGDIQQFLEEGGNVDAPGYFIEWLVHRRVVYGIMMPGAWYDIGTLEAYQTVVSEWQR